MTDDLPEGWAMTTLDDGLVVDVQPGFACGSHNRQGAGVAHLRPMNISEEGQIDLSNIKFVPQEQVYRDERLIRTGDVLFNNTNSPELVGKTAYYAETIPRAFSNHMTRIRCGQEAIDSKYCALVLHQKWREGFFESVCNNHVSQASVSRGVLLQTPIMLPPLAEQKRIVAKVEELLARVNAARERLARVPAILKRFRQSVLAAACSGRLTAEWRDNHRGAGIWKTVQLDDIGRVTGGITKNSSRLSLPKKVPYLRVANVYENRLELSEVLDIGVTPSEFERTKLKQGDLLFVEGNGSLDQIGRVALWDGSILDCVHQNHLIRFRASDCVLPEYALYWMMAPQGREQLIEQAISSAGLHSLSISKVACAKLELPDLDEQQEIVRRVEALLRFADAIEKRVTAATQRTDKLTQAILAKAFRGELVPTEAELARQEGRDYEPVSQLLERIRAGYNGSNAPTRRTIRQRRT